METKFARHILVIRRDVLFNRIFDNQFQGFRRCENLEVLSRIRNQCFWAEKTSAELNTNFKQVIGYTTIINERDKKVLVYRRSAKTSEYEETRLQGKFSWGVGGHIEINDLFNPNAIPDSSHREIKEEVDLQVNKQNFNLAGFINDDTDEVGQVHFGVLFIAKTDILNVSQKDPEIERAELISRSDLLSIINEFSVENFISPLIVENWSKIIAPYLLERYL